MSRSSKKANGFLNGEAGRIGKTHLAKKRGITYNIPCAEHAPVAQSDRAVVSGTASVGGSNPSGRTNYIILQSPSQWRGGFLVECNKKRVELVHSYEISYGFLIGFFL